MLLPELPTPDRLPPNDAGIVQQFSREDRIVNVCSFCGCVVAFGFEARHADACASQT